MINLFIDHFGSVNSGCSQRDFEPSIQKQAAELVSTISHEFDKSWVENLISDISTRVALKTAKVRTFKSILTNLGHVSTSPSKYEVRAYAIQVMNETLRQYGSYPISNIVVRDDACFKNEMTNAWTRLYREQQKRLGHTSKSSNLLHALKENVRTSLDNGLTPIPYVPQDGYSPFGYTELQKYLFLGIAPVTVFLEDERVLRLKNIHPNRSSFLASASELTEHDTQHAEILSALFKKLDLSNGANSKIWKDCFSKIVSETNNNDENVRTRLALFYHLHEDDNGFRFKNFLSTSSFNFREFVLERIMQKRNSSFSIEALLGDECASNVMPNSLRENLNKLAIGLYPDSVVSHDRLRDGFNRKLELACEAQISISSSSKKSNNDESTNGVHLSSATTQEDRNKLVALFNSEFNKWIDTMSSVERKFMTLEACEGARHARESWIQGIF